MATALPPKTENREDNFELQLSRVREKIKIKFFVLIDCLKARENELLRELDKILFIYHSYRNTLEKVDEKKMALENAKLSHQKELPTSPIKSFHEDGISRVITELKLLETPIEPKMVSFECDSNFILAELNNLGSFIENVRFDYKSKKEPIVSVCEKGNGIEQLKYPHGVTINDKTGNVYIADQSNHYVKVFDSTGKYLSRFGGRQSEAKMLYPRGLAIIGNAILISQSNHCLVHYQLDGEYISQIGKQGSGEVEFYFPLGLSINETNGDIYICEKGNKRIQILDRNFSFKSQFENEVFRAPLDVKLSKEFILVLDQTDPCLHLFSFNNHILQKSVISRGSRLQVVNPFYFFINHTDIILISDHDSNSITIFNHEYELVHKIPVLTCPMGVTIDYNGKVIVVTQGENNCLQIF